jgi:hypothetical protein
MLLRVYLLQRVPGGFLSKMHSVTAVHSFYVSRLETVLVVNKILG